MQKAVIKPVSFVDSKQKLLWLIKCAASLPAQTRVAMMVAQLVNQETSSATHVAKAISTDHVLTARVLKIANSPFYGSPRRIMTLTDAIVLLGMSAIRDIALSASCHELLIREAPAYALERGALWLHSICAGYAAQLLARHIHYHAPEEAYIAGLLHDIGKVAINEYMADEAAAVYDVSFAKQVTYAQAEREVFGFDHAMVGGAMCATWNLPSKLVDAVRLHHAPSEKSGVGVLPWVVHVADVCCMIVGVGMGGDGMRYRFDERAIDMLRLDNDTIEQVLAGIVEFSGIVSE